MLVLHASTKPPRKKIHVLSAQAQLPSALGSVDNSMIYQHRGGDGIEVTSSKIPDETVLLRPVAGWSIAKIRPDPARQ